jgi:hypothetical protein
MTEKEYINNLLPETRGVLDTRDEDRYKFLRANKWVPYPRAIEVLDKLETLLDEPKKPRMPNLLLVGESNNGKTSIVKEFWRRHPPTDGIEADAFPVVLIQSPPVPDENRLYSEILTRLLVPFRDKDPISQKEREVARYFSRIGARMLIIDEIHNVLSGSVPKQRAFMNALKNIGNNLTIPLVLVGVKDALRAVSTDIQISSRFKPMFLKRWKLDKDYVSLLASIELTLPLRKPSNLATKEIAMEILELSEGFIGEIVELINTAAAMAIKIGTERITIKEIKGCGYIKPSLRKSYEEIESL